MNKTPEFNSINLIASAETPSPIIEEFQLEIFNP